MDRIIEALSKADWTVLLTIIIGLCILLYIELLRNKKIIAKIEDLELHVGDLKSHISDKHENLGNAVSGKYKNLGEKISSEHMTIKKDTKSIHHMMLTEKQNREALYENTAHAKKILDTIDIMQEVVQKNAQLNQEVSQLKLQNAQILNAQNNMRALPQLMNALKSFEGKLSQFEEFIEAEEIRRQLKLIERQLTEYID